ncbi:recombinase family protein [Hyphomonas polymorpha]|uniref:recombinase family protein n=1 Tax=Hyphomonas polymorpha TaxID=74319 RepID=UPI003BB132DD
MTLRAAIYARYSSDLQSSRSIEDQVTVCRQFVRQQGWVETGLFADRALSGGAMVTRPAIQELISAAQDGRFNVIVAEALDRISRDQADTATIYKILAFHGVSIVTLSEGRVDPMHVGFKGVMNEIFLKELGRKTRRGQAGVVNSGRSAGGRCYGYDIVLGPKAGVLAVNETEAQIIRRILQLYADGQSPRSIAAILNREGVAAPRGTEWRASTINGQKHAGNGILNNELYIGRRIWNRRHKVTDPFTGKKRMRANPQSDWICTEAPELRIVDDDLWEAVKRRQVKYSNKRGAAKRPSRLLSGLLECGACGGPMSICAKDRYGCSAHREKGTCSNNRTILSTEIEARVMQGLKRAMLHPEAQKAAAREFHEELVRQQKANGTERFRLEKEIAEASRRIDRIVDAIADGVATASLKERLVDLETEKLDKQAALASLGAEPKVAVHPNAGELYAKLIGSLVEVISDPSADADEVRTILRQAVRRIHLTPRPDAPGYDILIKGDLAALLQSSDQKVHENQKKTPGSVSGTGGSLMVGAGTGFEPVTFRL